MTRERILAAGGLLSFVLLLLGHILVLPPYEGFDETAHYSSIAYIADEEALPWIGQARFDRTLAHELDGLPRPYSTLPPFEKNGGLSYRAFYQDQPDTIRQRASRRFWSPRSAPARFEQDETSAINGAAGHPPLYYALMVAPYRLSASWSPGASLLLLRLLSIGLACASYWVFWCSVRLLKDRQLRLRLLAGGLLALHSASLVFEFGRIGNDSLVVLLFSTIYYLLLRLVRDGMTSTRDFAFLGLVLGLGLMTKLYFVAVLGAALLFIFHAAFVRRIPKRLLLARVMLLVVVALLTGGWWYVLFKVRYGVFFGTHLTLEYRPPDAIQREALDFVLLTLRMFASAVSTFVWSGSWSFLRRTPAEYLLCAPFFLLAMFAFLRGWKHHTAEERLAHRAAAVLLLPMVGGTAWYIIDAVRHGVASSVVGGYYWLVAWPALAVLYSATFRTPVTRRILPVVLGFMVLFELVGWWKQLLLYAGVLAKLGDAKSGTGLVLPSLTVISTVVERLGLLSWPLMALGTVGAALVIRTSVVALLLRSAARDIDDQTT